MQQPSSGYVFISYSRRDADVTGRIVSFLRSQGIKVWLDNEKLIPGTPIWEEEIEKAINNAAAIVAVLSPDAKLSEWVRREITLTEQHRKRIFPVLVRGDENSSISLRLITRQFVDLRYNEEIGLRALSTAILDFLQENKSEVPDGKAEETQLSAQQIPIRSITQRFKREEVRKGTAQTAGTSKLPLMGLGLAGVLFFLICACGLVAARYLPGIVGGIGKPTGTSFVTVPTLASTTEPTPAEPITSPEPTGISPTTADICPDKPAVGYLNFSTDFDKWGINYFNPESIDLSETPPSNDWIKPSPQGLQRLYGILKFGESTQVGVILDVLDETESQMVFAFENDIDFSDNPVYKTIKGSITEPIVFQAHYADDIDQKYAINVYYPIDFAREIGAYRLHYYRGSLREGIIHLCNTDYNLAITDENVDGSYSDLGNTDVFLDTNGDGSISDDERTSALSPFLVDGTYYVVSDITASGARITIKQARFGEVNGSITDSQTGAPIAGAKVVLSPLQLSALTNSAGKYQMQAPEGAYNQVTATADGYAPNYVYLGNDQLVVDSKSLDISAIALTSVTAVSARSGIIRLEDRDSYHFLTGERFSLSGGDFYFGFYDGKAQFYANNEFQQGLVDLGDIGNVPLAQVQIPDSGYDRFGVEAILGHTYVSPAKKGEDGHYIVFRVTEIQPNQYIEIEFDYR